LMQPAPCIIQVFLYLIYFEIRYLTAITFDAASTLHHTSFLYLIYFEIRYLTAITFDVTIITIQANSTNTNPV
jgi:hypothetical protein